MKIKITIDERTMLSVLAIGVEKPIPEHRAIYLLNKLYGKDSCSLDISNGKVYEMFEKIAEKIKGK